MQKFGYPPLVEYQFLTNQDNMTKEEFDIILLEQKNLKDLQNSKLIEFMDKLSLDFDLVKKNIIDQTIYLDKIEELYNSILREYQKRS